MQYICDAGVSTWFRIETAGEATLESQVMNHAVDRYFREAHDKTNSLQNPKLPDWAILDITQPPNDESAGKVVAADFFNERWQVKPNMPPVDSK